VNILITGATGAIGSRVTDALEQKGHQIRTFSVDAPESDMFSPHVEVVTGDVTDKNAVKSAMQGVNAVVHMAALLHVANPSLDVHERFQRINVGGTSNVVEAAISANVKRIVFFSTIALYGPTNRQVTNENSPSHPQTRYARTKLAAEEIVLNARNADGEPIGTVLRLGAVYGSRVKGNYELMLHALARHRFIPIGNGFNRRTLVHDTDVARAAVLVMERPVAAGHIYNVTDGNFHTVNEIISAICRGLGRKSPRFSLPIAPVRFAAGILEGGARLCGHHPSITRATIDKYTEDVAVEGNRIQKELGFVPQVDLDTGWRETIREMRERGLL
jgi:nucleoside-diphosphate-sugar epimerase